MKLKRKLLIMIMVNILLLPKLITAENFAARLSEANLLSKSAIANSF